MSIKINPTFFLKGLDPQKLLSDYQSGVFARQPIIKSKIKIKENSIVLTPTYSTSNYSPLFSIKDKNNCSVIIATTNQKDFEIFTKTGGNLPIGGRCEYCREDFTHVSIGYPIAYQETLALCNDHYRVLYTFWVEGKFCTFECALGYVQLMLSKPSNYRDITIYDSERLLKLLYKLIHPTETLRPAQDPRLLKINGGPLTREEWQTKKHIYIRTDRVLIIPVKVEYLQQSLNPITIFNYIKEL